MLLFVFVVVRNAWVSDDAYITFRMVDNWVSGYGLRWNVAERVCASTHPLWMLLHAPLFAIGVRPFAATLALSVVASVATVWVFVAYVARTTPAALAGVTVLVFSKAFVDYSTSGLENPLTHLLAALFFAAFFAEPRARAKALVLWLSTCLGLAMTNRMDTVVLFVPAMVQAMVTSRVPGRFRLVALGLAPFVLWEAFSVVYYGFPLPNPAYAKVLETGISRWDLAHQGLLYLRHAAVTDPVTVIALAGGVLAAVVTRDLRRACAAAGICLYVVYVVLVGGDFMSGRFLSAPLLLGVMILGTCELAATARRAAISVGSTVVVALVAGDPPVATSSDGGSSARPAVDDGITDERAAYFATAGLINAWRFDEMPAHPSAERGRRARATFRDGETITARSVGYFGYYAGPRLYIIDLYGLGDPLLARLPAAQARGGWRIGHFLRTVPEGYARSVVLERDVIEDDAVRRYYDLLRLVTRGPLLGADRWRAIWKLNTGGA